MCPPFFLPPGKNVDIMEGITNSHLMLQDESHDEDGLIIKVGGPWVTLVKDFIYCGLLMWGSCILFESRFFVGVFLFCFFFALITNLPVSFAMYFWNHTVSLFFLGHQLSTRNCEYSEIESTAVGIGSITAVTGHLDWQFFIMASISMKINMRLMNTNYNEEE